MEPEITKLLLAAELAALRLLEHGAMIIIDDENGNNET